MLPQEVREGLEKLASKTVSMLLLLPMTQALIIRKQRKFDRIDIKVLKQATKLNNKQEVKWEGDGPVKRKGSITYKSYSIQFKKKLIASIREEVRQHEGSLARLIRQRAKDLGIHPKNITRWYHTKELKKKEGGRKALYPEMEVRLANFILNNPSLRRKHILQQAKKIMEELQIPGRQDFNFSKGWYQRFRERLNKSKVFAEVKHEDDQVKYQVKLEDLHPKQDEDDEEHTQDEDSFASQDYSEDEQEEVKLQEQLKLQEEREQNKYKPMRTGRSIKETLRVSKKESSLFFEDEIEKQTNSNSSLANVLQQQKEGVNRMLHMIK